MKYYASVSFGKDSLAMVLGLIERGYKLDGVVFYDTGMEFECIYRNRDKLKVLLDQSHIPFYQLHPQSPFLYDMLERPVKGHINGDHCGYGWCGGPVRWGTTIKTRTVNNFVGDNMVYIGIAADELIRLDRLADNAIAPLAQWGMTEKDALAYCLARGWNWLEGDIELYSILDRVSCWCCANKNLRELRNIYHYLPAYWEKLKYLQDKIDTPFKKYHNKTYGDYGYINELEEIFKKENKNES